MRANDAMQLKAQINDRASKEGVSPAYAMQAYVLERLIVGLAMSPYRDAVVVKGGVLIVSLIGIDKRTTVDLDATVRGFTLTHMAIREAFEGICAVEIDGDLTYSVVGMSNMRETDDYPGIRVHLNADYPPLSMLLKVEATTGNRIVPAVVRYPYRLSFDDETVHILSYPTAAVPTDKLETIFSRGATNTKPRDFCDIYMLWQLRRDDFTLEELSTAPK